MVRLDLIFDYPDLFLSQAVKLLPQFVDYVLASAFCPWFPPRRFVCPRRLRRHQGGYDRLRMRSLLRLETAVFIQQSLLFLR